MLQRALIAGALTAALFAGALFLPPATVQAQTCKGSWDRCNPQVVRAKKKQSGKTNSQGKAKTVPAGSVRFLRDPVR
jgi:hypothetical protein